MSHEMRRRTPNLQSRLADIGYSAESVRTFFKDITGPPLARRGAGEDISVRGNLSRLQFPGGFVILAESQLGAECRYTVEDGDT